MWPKVAVGGRSALLVANTSRGQYLGISYVLMPANPEHLPGTFQVELASFGLSSIVDAVKQRVR